eukprot:CAMPEP_0117655768 /NCGR_PEP_ID=MMETSP0804-20121206/4453_1 /TAXON_ID=1074897 /ORGANISM="Tetraselmis astigmatica, Strain CCMP880" /LENGTH=422 /DNA_ID=CAMNT_0005462137 /DNA_START=132 /DNA_END=1403 /DNA_ORIENTATION=+
MRTALLVLLLLPSAVVFLVGPRAYRERSQSPHRHPQPDPTRVAAELLDAIEGVAEELPDDGGLSAWTGASHLNKRQGRRRKTDRFQGCGGRSTLQLPAKPESLQQSRLWQALVNLRVQFVVAGPQAKPSSFHRISPLIVSRRMFVQRNADGVLGFKEGLSVRPLSPECAEAPRTLHIPEKLMSELPHDEPSRWSFSSCAIVGNSGRLMHASHGEEIDAHEAVFRINYAPIDSYAKYVGRRTTFDVINAVHSRALVRESHNSTADGQPLAARGSRRNSTLVVFELENKSAKTMYGRLMQLFNDGNPDSFKAVVMAPELVLHSNWLFQVLRRQIQANTKQAFHSKAMSGWYATMLALQVCRQADVYGFSPFVSGEGHWHGRYHYFDTNVQPALQSHSFDMAYAAIREVSLYPCSPVNLAVHLDD